MITIPERLMPQTERHRKLLEGFGAELRVAAPGIIKSFDPAKQTVSVQIAIKERVKINGKISHEEIPPLVDVPIVLPRAGGYVATFPIQPGDECLVIFGDNCMDGWYQSGGTQQQMDKRRHDLSDGYAVLGVWSQPKKISNYSTDSVQLRTEDGDSYIEIKGDHIKMRSRYLDHWHDHTTYRGYDGADAAGDVSIKGATITIDSAGNTSIDGRNFIGHHHKDVEPGTGNTGDVV